MRMPRPPVPSLFVIDVSGDAAAYVERLRSVLAPAVRPDRPVSMSGWTVGGEPSFGCQDLLWAVFTAGAVRVEGPMVQITSSREKP